jgi:hypothetical protein
VTAQMYYSLVGRGLEYEFQSFAEYYNIGILVCRFSERYL